MTAVCKITNGIDYVSLVGDVFHIDEWRPAGVPFKSDGYWQDPVMADGRRLAQYSLGNMTETITFSQRSLSQNAAIRQINKLSSLLLEAAEFSVKPKHGRRPVYLEVKATSESNTRYAQIHAGHVGEYGNPFAQPFLQPNCQASATNLTMVIERGPWLELPPGQETCQEIAPTGSPSEANLYTYEDIILGRAKQTGLATVADSPNGIYVISQPAFALWKLNETSGSVANNSSQYAGLNGTYGAGASPNLRFWNVTDSSTFMSLASPNLDIYSTALNQRFSGTEGSLLLWVNTSGLIWTGGNDAYFINIQVDADNYVRIYHPGTVVNNSVQWEYKAGAGSPASYRVDDFSPADEWFSVGMTWSQFQSGFQNVRFYLNGGLVAARFYSPSWSGSLSSTQAVVGQLDNTNSTGEGAASDIAWVALWDAPLTDNDMEIIGVPNLGFVESTDLDCEDIVAYVGNKNNTARLTHAFTHDASPSTFGSNVITASPPFALLPSTIAANDAIYFGIRTSSGSGLPSGPFNSLVLDIATPANATTSYAYTWEYHTGGSPGTWSTLTYVDNTDGFQEEGINSVHWEQPSDWTTVSVNSITAYWVRLRVTSVSGSWTQPLAQDNPYTIVWNTIDVPSLATGGSLPSLVRIRLDNEADSPSWERVVVGLRSDRLAPNFVSYIPLSDTQSPLGVSVSVLTNAAFQNDTTAVTGRSINLTSGTATMVPRWTVSVDWARVPSYFGSYKVFVLYTLNNAGATENIAQLRIKAGSGYNHLIVDAGVYLVSQAVTPPTYIVHELGEVTIRPDSFLGDSLDTIEFSWWSTTSASIDVDFHALVLIPTDEWVGDFGTNPLTSSNLGQVAGSRYLSLDSTRYLNRAVVAEPREIITDLGVARWQQSHNGPIRLQPTGRQKFHFLFMRTDQEETPAYVEGAVPHAAATAKLYRNRRYHYGRGDE